MVIVGFDVREETKWDEETFCHVGRGWKKALV
jgi:hypothetical protein